MPPSEESETQSIVGRASAVDSEYCRFCDCPVCSTTRDRGYCPTCGCSKCAPSEKDQESKDKDYENPEDDNPKRKRSKVETLKNSRDLPATPSRRGIHGSVASSLATARAHTDTAALQAAGITEPGIMRFCLVTFGSTAADCLETCHLVPRALDEDNYAKLEFAWGYKYDGLHLHTRHNLITLNASLHASFDKGCWALVPLDISILDRMSDFFSDDSWRTKKQDNDRMEKLCEHRTSFNYALVPLLPTKNGMTIPLTRRNLDAWAEIPNNDNCKTHFFPYSTLPIITSHARPHFVIFNLMSKLRTSGVNHTFVVADTIYRQVNRQHALLPVALQTSAALYDMWTSQSPPPSFSPSKASTTEPD
ncbi:hypothetical protein BDN70DRAFT_879371 [Pholiota conissans]|uniref:HNH nuclease domain-containing protein n=1 Tax=Pholiota conissans TaxID=109636 RepID=A0A9P6CT52_9AGAR|nr:hypothetical protein BDN70DRAFT_879371 [Pholiota conissans]